MKSLNFNTRRDFRDYESSLIFHQRKPKSRMENVDHLDQSPDVLKVSQLYWKDENQKQTTNDFHRNSKVVLSNCTHNEPSCMRHWNNTLIVMTGEIVKHLPASVLKTMQSGEFLHCLCQDEISISVHHLLGFSGLWMEPHRITQGQVSCIFQRVNNMRFSLPEYMCLILLILTKL